MRARLTATTALTLAALSGACAQQPGDQVWWFPTGGPVVASPSIDARGNILFGCEDFFAYSVNPEQRVNWIAKAADMITGNIAVSPLGFSVFGSWDGAVYAVNSDGSPRWTFATQAFISASPAIAVNGTVYIGTRDGIFHALRPDGSLKWFFVANGAINAGPAIGPDGTVYFGDASGTLFALNPEGSLKWQFGADVIPDRNPRIRTIPAIDRDGTIYFGSGNHFFYALRPDGSLKWRFETGDKNDSSPVIDQQGHVLFGSRDGYLYKLAPALGVPVWARLVGDVFYCSPAVDAMDNVYIAAFAGGGISRLHALDASANLLWARNFSGLNDSSPALSTDGHLYIGFHDGGLYKLYTGHGPAASAWPMQARNAARTAALDEAFAAAALSGDWFWSDWFGWVSRAGESWFYHYTHGWLHLLSRDPDNLWFHDHALGARGWTSRTHYPFLLFPSHGWVYYQRGTAGSERLFFSYSANQWLGEAAFRDRL